MSKIVADHWRQLDFYKPMQDTHANVLIVGAGSIGSYTAFGLARMGVKRIVVIDHDKVEGHNLPNQFFSEINMEENIFKVTALQQTIGLMMSNINLKVYPMKIESFLETDDYKNTSFNCVVCAVDDMEVRKQMWERLSHVNLYLDARVGGLYANIFSIKTSSRRASDYYTQSLHSNAEAAELPCSGRSVVDVSMAVSAELIARYRTYAMTNELIPIHTFHDYKIHQAYGLEFYKES